jgi:crotonobetainyl-CoA:carnitine CoA-transferase CaiB-like acyl-CoA transferase
VINILLALRQREVSGQGCHLDIAMTDAMFTFCWLALAQGETTGRFPAPGELPLAGGSPRYQLYPTRDRRLVACAALEQKFWLAFTAAIGLDPALVDDASDPAATKAAVAAIIVREPAAHWRAVFAAADCCATVVRSLEEALADPHFVARGLFAYDVSSASGRTMPALPVPIAPLFRERVGTARPAPLLGADAATLLDPSPTKAPPA